MKFSKYLLEKMSLIGIYLIGYVFILIALIAYNNIFSLIILMSFIYFLVGISIFLINFFKKKTFYDNLLENIKELDKKYLVLELMDEPEFYEGKIFVQALYEINKSMQENIKQYENRTNNFKEYVELWIHEVKVPLSALLLITHNNKNINKEVIEQVKEIEDLVEQVLYYVRSENAEQDYLITECSLNKIISNVALRNKDIIFREKIDLFVENIDYTVLTDSKWLEFILNQIINNSIKYKKEHNSYIKISAQADNDKTILIIEDNGIGISASDLPKVFNNSFTGKNGRIRKKATGMGLFIVKNLCDKLGHKIEVQSEENKYTKIYIIFPKNRFYEEIR